MKTWACGSEAGSLADTSRLWIWRLTTIQKKKRNKVCVSLSVAGLTHRTPRIEHKMEKEFFFSEPGMVMYICNLSTQKLRQEHGRFETDLP